MDATGEEHASLEAAPEQADAWLPWLATRWMAVAGTMLAAPLAVVALIGIVEFWPGRTFPGFFVLGNRIVPSVGLYSWTGIESGVPFHSRVVAIDEVPVASSREIYERVASKPVGSPLVYTLRKDGEDVRLIVPSMRFGAADFWLTVGIMLFFGLASVGLGIVVGFLQPWTPQAEAYLVQGVLAGVFAITAVGLYQPGLWWMIHPHLVAQATFPAALIHLGLVFPVPRRAVERHPGVVALPYLVSASLVAWAVRVFYAEPPDMTPFHAMYAFSGLSVLALVVLLGLSFAEQRRPDVRRQLYAVLPGLVLGTSVGLYGFFNTARGGGDFPINLVAFTPFFFYLAVGYAIARYDLFDIDAVLKRALAYGMLTLGIIGAYAGTVTVVDAFARAPISPPGRWFTITFVVLIAILFEPARARVQGLVDRLFSRDRVSYRSTVSQLSSDLTRLLDLEQLIDRVGRTVHESLGLGSSAVLLWHPDVRSASRYDDAGRCMKPASLARFDAIEGFLAGRRSDRPWRPGRDGEHHAAAEAQAEREDVSLVIPMRLGERVIGALALGRRRSGHVLGRSEIDLLRTLAAQAAVAVGNAVSYRALATVNADLEDKVAARTAELSMSHTELSRAYEELRATEAQLVHSEKMASLGVLVAGVAHEINNPITFIVGGLDPLRDAIASLRAGSTADPRITATLERMDRAVGAITRGAERTAGIVRDLRSFSRLADSTRQTVDLHEDLEVTLRLLHPRLADRILVHREYGELPPLDAMADELNQVWMNLLANACDAIIERGNVWITTACRDGWLVVTVRDDGRGIPPHVQPRIFDPFFTTKPPGEGTGLGLAVSHGIVTRHGGRIVVESDGTTGATFTVWLPHHHRVA